MAQGEHAAHEWMYTGDVGKISATGMLSLIGRFNNALIVDGQYFAPEQLEQQLIGLPFVRDVAAISMPFAAGGSELWVTIISDQDLDEAHIRQFLLSYNPRWKVAQIKRVDRIKRNEMGKIVRPCA